MMKRILTLIILVTLLLVLLPLTKKEVRLGDYTITSVVNTPSNQIANLTKANTWNLLQTFAGSLTANYITATSTTATSTFQSIAYVGNFGEIYVSDASTAQSIPNGATYTKVTAFTTNGESSNLIPEASNDRILIKRAGKYKVTANVSAMSGTINATFRGVIFVDGIEHNDAHNQVKFAALSTNLAFPLSAIITATSTSEVDLRVRHDQAGAVNFTVSDANLNVIYLGE